MVPLMLFIIWAFLPVGRVWDDPRPDFVAANGQLLAFTRAAYEDDRRSRGGARLGAGRHGTGQRAKRLGLHLRLADGTGTTRTRMYRSAGEVWRGFSKNALTLLHDRPTRGGVHRAAGRAVCRARRGAPGGVVCREGGLGMAMVSARLVVLMLVQRAIFGWRARLPLLARGAASLQCAGVRADSGELGALAAAGVRGVERAGLRHHPGIAAGRTIRYSGTAPISVNPQPMQRRHRVATEPRDCGEHRQRQPEKTEGDERQRGQPWRFTPPQDPRGAEVDHECDAQPAREVR